MSALETVLNFLSSLTLMDISRTGMLVGSLSRILVHTAMILKGSVLMFENQPDPTCID